MGIAGALSDPDKRYPVSNTRHQADASLECSEEVCLLKGQMNEYLYLKIKESLTQTPGSVKHTEAPVRDVIQLLQRKHKAVNKRNSL